MWESKEGYQRLMIAIDLGFFTNTVSPEVLVWIVTEGIGDKGGGPYKPGALETQNNEWIQDCLRLLDTWWGENNIWFPSFTT